MKLPIILDIEASGFGTSSYPIEIGFVMDNQETWCSLIKPQVDWQHWDESAEQVHQIARPILLTHGKDAGLVARYLNDQLQGQTVYSDSWAHDFVWLWRLFDAVDAMPHFKFEDMRAILTPQQEASWHATKDAVIKELDAKRHRASADAKVLQMTWQRTREMS